MRATPVSRRSAVAVALVALILAGCAREGTVQAGGEGVCALIVTFRGEQYEGVGHVLVEPPIGEALGEAVIPPCDETGTSQPTEGEERITVKRLNGIDPDVAIVWDNGPPSTILVHEDVGELPPELEAYFERPGCDARIAPIDLFGTWIGIIQPDGTTEVDLEPPYDLEVVVLEASDPRYEGADLIVRVPVSAGRLISRSNVRTSLWEGGSIDIEARCDGRRFLATSLRTYPG